MQKHMHKRDPSIFENVRIDESIFENISQTLLASLFAFFIFLIPFLFPAPQLLTGTIVNAILILGALLLKGNKPYYLVFLPALATFANGLLFGPFSFFLLFMLPFIWMGNALLVYVFRALYVSKKTGYLLTLTLASGAKSLFLFLCASALLYLSIIPALIANAMGLLQLITALLGGVLAYAALKFYGMLANSLPTQRKR